MWPRLAPVGGSDLLAFGPNPLPLHHIFDEVALHQQRHPVW